MVAGGASWAGLKFKLTSVTFLCAGEQRCYITPHSRHAHTPVGHTGEQKSVHTRGHEVHGIRSSGLSVTSLMLVSRGGGPLLSAWLAGP